MDASAITFQFQDDPSGAICLRVAGPLDAGGAHRLEVELDDVRRHADGNVLVDLQQVTLADSGVLGVLLRESAHLRARGSHLSVVRPSEPVRLLLHLSGVDKHVAVAP